MSIERRRMTQVVCIQCIRFLYIFFFLIFFLFLDSEDDLELLLDKSKNYNTRSPPKKILVSRKNITKLKEN